MSQPDFDQFVRDFSASLAESGRRLRENLSSVVTFLPPADESDDAADTNYDVRTRARAIVRVPIKPGIARRLGLRDPRRPDVRWARYPRRWVMGMGDDPPVTH